MLHAVAALWLAAAPGRLPAPGPWQTSGPAYPQIEAIALVPGDESVVYAAARDLESSTSGLFRSEDGGLTWDLLAQAPFQASVLRVAIDPTGSNRLLALTRTPGAVDLLYRTEDGGISWRQTKAFAAQAVVETVFFDPIAADTAYLLAGVSTGSEFLERSDAGGAWNNLAGAESAWVSPQGPLYRVESIFFGCPFPYPFPCNQDALYLSTTQGRTFVKLGQGIDLYSGSVAYAPSDSFIAYATSQYGEFLTSENGGGSWAPVADSDLTEILGTISGGLIARIAVDPLEAGTIFLTAVSADPTDGLLLRSKDGGVHWTRVPVPEPPTGPLAIGPTSRVLFVGTVQGVFRLPLGRTQTLPPR
jgi:hypothetical protein